MAWRNLWRNRRRTLITLSSIAFGAMLAVITTGVGDRNFSDMINLAARLGGGHVTLQHAEYLDTPTFSRTLRDVAGLRERALGDPEVLRAVTRISGQLMLSTAGQTYGAMFIAFDPEAEDVDTLSLLEALHEGELFETSSQSGIILGERLAANLDAALGKKVVYTLTDKDGEIVQEAVRVVGILRTGAPSIDARMAMLPLDRLRASLGYAPDEAVQVGLFLDDQRKAMAVAERLSAAVGPAVAALPWYEANAELAGFIAMKVAGARFIQLVVMLLVAAGIFNTLFVSVMERLREFGIMLAIGFSPRRLFGLVMVESLWLGLGGVVLGAVVTAGPYYYFATTGINVIEQMGMAGTEVAGVAMPGVMYIGIYPENAVLIAIAAVLATLAAGVYPAWKAGKVAPVESIRLV